MVPWPQHRVAEVSLRMQVAGFDSTVLRIMGMNKSHRLRLRYSRILCGSWIPADPAEHWQHKPV